MNKNTDNIPVIDMHCHIGDILYPSGEKIIFENGIKFPRSSLYQFYLEKNLFRKIWVNSILDTLYPLWETHMERRRNESATLQNFKKTLCQLKIDKNIEITNSVCLPVAPNTMYEDVKAAGKAFPHIIAFTSPDFTLPESSMKEKLLSDLKDGAAGVKIHPIIQKKEADSEEVIKVIETVSAYASYIPVLFHAGKAVYYTPKEKKENFKENASAEKITKVIAAFPHISFILGHAGLGEMQSFIELLKGYKNVYADTSFQPPEAIKTLISVYGGDRVLFASDWPYGFRKPALLSAIKACGGDYSLLKQVLYDNAAGLLKL